MNTVRFNILKKVNAIMIIISLLISNFWIVGEAAVSYAVELAETNNSNVSFSAYFLDSNGEKVEKLEKGIDEEEQYLFLDISVKNEGYFNGTVNFENNNFNLKQDVLSEYISEISEDNVVTLKQINAGSTVSIKLAIEPIINETITQNTLSSEVNVLLQGKYVNSKNIEKDKFIEIEGTSKIEVNWLSSEEVKAELEANLLTNSIYKIEEEEKRIVQFIVESTIVNNSYPIKSTEINLSTLNNAESIKVHARSTEATNKNIEFSEDNYVYNEQDGSLSINVKNEDEENISWNKEVKDTFIITYVFNKDENITNNDITINSNIITFDNKTLTANKTVKMEEKEGVVSFDIKSEESSIYKGKIYTAEEREYKTINTINVDYLNLINNITLKINESKYLANEEEVQANIIYKQSKISKEKFLEIFGEEGFLTVKDDQGVIMANINKDSKTDENGDIIVYYFGEVKNIEITTSKPENIGSLDIEHTKIIENSNLPREKINELTAIKETITGNYNEEKDINKEMLIELKNTISKAELEINTEKLSTIEKNENIKITAILLNSDEEKDLYQNPVIRIAFPKQVEHISAKCKLLYGNGLNLGSAKIVKENDINIMEVHLTGTQTTYNTEILKGTTLIIYADIELDELAPNSNEKITLTYTNEIGTNFENNGIIEQPIEIQSLQGVITTNSIETVKTVGEQETEKINLPVSKSSKDSKVNISIINNKGAEIQDVKILGTFPTKELDNLGVTLTSGINITTENKNIEIYYSNNEKVTDDLKDTSNGWSKNISADKAKHYLIKVDNINQGEKIEANYEIKIPENLAYNMSANESYTVKYINTQNGEQEEEKATTIELTTGIGPDIDIDIKATVGNDEVGIGTDKPQNTGANVTVGEIIKYEVTLKNNGNVDATNVILKEKIPDNTTALKYGRDGLTNEMFTPVYDYEEIEGNEHKCILEQLKVGEAKKVTLYLRVNYIEEQTKVITNNIEVCYNDRVENKYLTNLVNKGNIKARLMSESISSDIEILEEDKKYEYTLLLSNITEKQVQNIDVEFLIDGETQISRIQYFKDGQEILAENTNKINIASIEPLDSIGVYVTFVPKTKEAKSEEFGLYAIVKENNRYQVRTNKIKKQINTFEINLDIEANNVGEIVTPGQEIDYTINVKNPETSVDVRSIVIEDAFANIIDVQSVEMDGKILLDNEYKLIPDWDNEENGYILNITTSLNRGEEKTIVVKTKVLDSAQKMIAKDREFQNNAVAKRNEQVTANSDKVMHILKAPVKEVNPDYISDDEDFDENEEQNETENNEEDETTNIGQNEVENNQVNEETNIEQNEVQDNQSNEITNQTATQTTNEKTYSISGTAWLDKNEDGIRDIKEEKISNIPVILMNVDTNDQVSEVTTDNEGTYTFSQIPKGKYIVIFKYDTEKYVLTKYQLENVNENKNSDVEFSEITINGEELKTGITDTIEIKDSSKMNIDIGLIEAKVFDLELTKSINKVTVTNSKGTESTNYQDVQIAKLDIDAKYLKGTTVVIEYKIKVKNNGELAGYAKEIADYMPADLTFNSELNKDWYKSGNYVYSTALTNTKIESGETKELTLVLTKTMTETNTGLVNNLAEISSNYNSLNIQDIDSIPGNRKKTEDDLGSANLIISVKTGAAISYISITITVIAVIVAGAYIVNKKILKENIKL